MAKGDQFPDKDKGMSRKNKNNYDEPKDKKNKKLPHVKDSVPLKPKRDVEKTKMHPKKDLNTPPKGWTEKKYRVNEEPPDIRDDPRHKKTKDEKDDLNWRRPNDKYPKTTGPRDEEHSRVKKSKDYHDQGISGSGWRMKDKKKDPIENKPPKPKGGYPDHPQGMSGGSSVPRKPGPKKPASPAAKRLQRTASRSK